MMSMWTDLGDDVELGTCEPPLGSSLAPGSVMICTARHAVTAVDIAEGVYINTAFADSDRTDPVSDTENRSTEWRPGNQY